SYLRSGRHRRHRLPHRLWRARDIVLFPASVMRGLVIGGVVYLGLATAGWLIGGFFVNDSLFKTETLTVYVPEPHVIREIITLSPSPTLTPQPLEANSPESGQPEVSSTPEAQAVPIAIAPTPVRTPAPTVPRTLAAPPVTT